jgi:hypothetical protein
MLLMKLPLKSYDANFHIFFGSHYVHHWFDPWNVKWFGGFSQTTYPPLTHQWIALFSHIMGLKWAYMLVLAMGSSMCHTTCSSSSTRRLPDRVSRSSPRRVHRISA